MNNILVVNVNWLGDAVFSTPVFKALKDNFPKSRVSCLCVPRVKKVLEFCPFIDEIIVYDERGEHLFPWSKWGLVQQLRQLRFDSVFMLHRSSTRALLMLLAGIPQRIGYCKSEGLLTKPVHFFDQGIHRRDVYLRVLEEYGLKVKDRSCQLKIKPEDMQSLGRILHSKGVDSAEQIVVLHTSGNWELKRWPASHFVKLIQMIGQRFKCKILLSGAQSDFSYCQGINQDAGNKVVNLAGELSLGQSLALYHKANVVVSSDSGPLHLAHSVGASVVGIYGPTRVEITGPCGTGEVQVFFNDIGCNKAPCYHLECKNNLCMQSTRVDDVFKAVETFLN